ncbi:MAG: rod shape-determining protein MreC [Pseudomonadota bacterium]
MAEIARDGFYKRKLKRLSLFLLCVFLIAITLVWRIDNTRGERIRLAIMDQVVPVANFINAPLVRFSNLMLNLQSYERLQAQNEELRRELQQMRAWREAAIQLEQENARLLDLNNVKLDPELTFVTGEVVIDATSPFRQSALVNLGTSDRIQDGWAVMDGLGLIGRISGVGTDHSRILMITDSQSRIPIQIKPSEQKALMLGDNTALPALEFIEREDQIQPGDRVFSSGDGGVFPPDLLVGTVVRATDGRLRIRPAADLLRLEFVRIVRHSPSAPITLPDRLIGPTLPSVTRGPNKVNDG